MYLNLNKGLKTIIHYFKNQKLPENTIKDLEEARLDPLIPYYVTKELNNVTVTDALPVLLFEICTLFL